MEYSDFEGSEGWNVHRLEVASKLSDLPMNRGSNISPQALGMSLRSGMGKRRSTQSENERKMMYLRDFGKNSVCNDVLAASDLLKRIETSCNSAVLTEALETRTRLRRLALKNFAKNNFSDALIEAHYSLLLAKRFYSGVKKTPLCGEMAMELLVLSKCYAQIGHFARGREHLSELRFLVENTLAKKSDRISQAECVIECENELLLGIVYLLAEILTSYGMWEDAELFFAKYLSLASLVYGESNAAISGALNSVCIYMLKSRQYLKALPMCVKSLEILVSNFGDFESAEPDLRVADAYNNLGIVYRLLNNPIDALDNFFKAIDMKMRVYKDRANSAVQDVFLSIGCCLHSLGHLGSAASIYLEVYHFRANSLGKNHPSTVAVYQMLDDLKRDLALQPEPEVNPVTEFSPVKVEERLEIPFVDVCRIKALYDSKVEFTDTGLRLKNVQPVLFPTEQLLDLSRLSQKLLKLPVINVPKLARGTLYLKDGVPAMMLNPDAQDLCLRWGVELPEVDLAGNLTNLGLKHDDVTVSLPLFNFNGEPVLGFNNKQFYVPNPALHYLQRPTQDTQLTQQSKGAKLIQSNKVTKFSPNNSDVLNERRSNGLDEKVEISGGKGVEVEEDLNKIASVERLKSVTFVESVKPVEEKVVEVSIGDLVKNRLKNSKNAKFLAKIGALSNIKVKQVISPESQNALLQVNRTKAPSHRAILPQSDSDDETVIASSEYAVSSPETPIHSDSETLFSSPVVFAANEPVTLPLRLKKQGKIEVEIARKVAKLKTNLDRPDEGCVLLDADGVELAWVPFAVDFTSFTLPKSYFDLFSLSKTVESVKHSENETETEICKKLVSGEGLKELGFGKIAASLGAFGGDLGSGLALKVPSSVLQSIKEQKLKLEAKQSEKSDEVVKKETVVKKAPVVPVKGKKAPPPPAKGKKAPLAPKLGKMVPTKSAKVKEKAVESNVRRFFWDPIFGDDAKDTIFASQKAIPKLETERIEESFAKSTPKAKDKTSDSAKPKLISLIPDSKRSYNMNIGLSKFSKFTFDELREAVVNLDTKILDADNTESLLLLIPTAEEVSIVSEFVKSGGDLSLVDRPEQFVSALIGVPILRQRLECHQAALTFKDNYNEIYEPLELITESCEAVTSSVKLNVFSHLILSVGNTLNQGDLKKGNAEGFKPTTLPKLNDFRTTTKPSRTLLQYICDIVVEEDESVLELLDDLKCLDLACKIDVSLLEEKLNRLKSDVNKIKNGVKLAGEKAQNDPFASIMAEFLHDAEPKLNALLQHHQDVMALFRDTVRFTGFTEKELERVKPAELFRYLWTFAQSVEAYRRNRIQEKMKLERRNKNQLKNKDTKLVSTHQYH